VLAYPQTLEVVINNLRPFAMLAAAALALVGLVPTASASGTTTIYPLNETVIFNSSNYGQVPVDYTCSVPTNSYDALDVRLVQEDGAAFVGSSSVTCDGTRQSVVVDIAGEGPAGQLVHAGPGRVQVSLQGVGVEQAVTIVPQDSEPHPPVVTPYITVDGDVVFTTATQGSITLDFACNEWASGIDVSIQGEDTATGNGGIACAVEHTVTVPLTAQGAGFSTGSQTVKVHATLGDVEVAIDTSATLTRAAPPAPVKAAVALTANASPESVVKGKKITVAGTIRRNGKKVKVTTALQFRADGGDYVKVKSVESSSKGALKTTVKASRSGSFRYGYAGNATTEPGTSSGDHIVVTKPKPKPKTYKNCTALVKVYPHGVGKTGAKDKGGDVRSFTRDSKTYAKNKKSDRDKDGIACER
jgi:excalibur calcium-binding domain-containing protein